MSNARGKVYCADFETTVYEGQTDTQVWAAAIVDINDEYDNVLIFNSIEKFMNFLVAQHCTLKVYFHNLKFDGSFILNHVLTIGYTQAFKGDKPLTDKDMPKRSVKYLISDMGQWYTLTVKLETGKVVTFYDSFKLLPFSVKKIGEAFNTKYKKLTMEYIGYREPNGVITEAEQEYIKNDVLVMKEALHVMFLRGHKNMTIGSCCLSEYRRIIGKNKFNTLYPTLNIALPSNVTFTDESIDSFIRRSYKGGFCYLKKGCENKTYDNGIVADVNSLYPSVMMSDRLYPTGEPIFWQGDYIPQWAEQGYYFIRIRTRFYTKFNMLPCIQIKNNSMYRPNEWLETSDIYNNKTGEYQGYYYDIDGNEQEANVELTLTMTDWKLIQEHYHLINCEILGGCAFNVKTGNELFHEYLWFYKDMKVNANTTVDRTIAKLFSNNLYGKMATSTNSSYKTAYLIDGVLHYNTVLEFDKKPIYIPVGSAITSYAREFTIRHAQKNYKHFIYADTDSIHCNCSTSDLIDIKVDNREYGYWKLEATFDKAVYLRQKAYIEHVIQENLIDCTPYYNVKYAGMGKRSKQLIRKALGEDIELDELTKHEQDFLMHRLDITDIKRGLVVPSNLRARNIKGGVLLEYNDMEIR